MPRTVLGLDIGGANLKAAHTCGMAAIRPFELWKHPQGLADALLGLLAGFLPYDLIAITMTGELCDCFETKRQGVSFILDAVEKVSAGVPVQVWRNDGSLVNLATARQTPLQVAAANWLALATWIGHLVPTGPGLVVDIGSTTTDLIPLVDGVPVPRGRTDPERLSQQELVYVGVRRTPLCAVLGMGAAAELFATTHDVFLLFGAVPEDSNDCDTADGRPSTRAAAHARLTRMLCSDTEACSSAQTRRLAERVLLRLQHRLQTAVAIVSEALPGPLQTIILSGSGEFLARVALDQQLQRATHIMSLREMLGPERSQSACAYALAMLAQEESNNRG